MNYFDLLTDDIIIKIIDMICDEIEVEIEEIDFTVDCIKTDYADFIIENHPGFQDPFWKSLDWRNHPDNGDPYDTDDLEQFYQNEM